MKLACGSSQDQLEQYGDDFLRVLLYGRTETKTIASAGAAILEVVKTRQLKPPPKAWDLLSIALSVVTADTAVLTTHSPDGWTREIEITIEVLDVDFWQSQQAQVQQMLRFLSGDLWTVHFAKGNLFHYLKKSPRYWDADCVSLLSGGLDSLIGAIDIVASGSTPLVVSQVAQGDKDKQIKFASEIGGGLHHLQFAHNATVPGTTDDTQRARSIVFLAYGVLAATTLAQYQDNETVPLYVCENGFISINPPLTDMRIGSLSTRTTHPTYIGLFQCLLDKCGLNVKVKNPYQLKTKGRMMQECADQEYLLATAWKSTSCGRFGRTYQQCGRCLPCLIRRSAFLEWKQADATSYIYDDLGRKDVDHAFFDDVRAASMAIATINSDGVERWVGAQLSSEFIQDPRPYLDLIELGVCELAMFLENQGVS